MTRQSGTESLVHKAREGDRGAFEALVEQCRGRLQITLSARIRKHYLHRELEVDDVLQETLTRAFECIEKFQWQSEDSFYRWLCGIAIRVILEGARRRQRKTHFSLVADPAATGTSPSRALRREERLGRLKDALKNLSPHHREVVLLARIDGLRIQEIAERMKRSPDAVKKLLSRALKNLKHSFGETESLHLPDRGLGSQGVTDDGSR